MNTKAVVIKVDIDDYGNLVFVLIVTLPAGRLYHWTCGLLKKKKTYDKRDREREREKGTTVTMATTGPRKGDWRGRG
jgi:hypothetical protein